MLIHPDIDPIALRLGPLAVHWYGVTYLVAFGLFYALARARQRVEQPERDQVGHAVPVHGQRAQAQRDGVDVGVDQHGADCARVARGRPAAPAWGALRRMAA